MSRMLDQRIAIIESIWIGTPPMAQIHHQLDECRERSRISREPRCMFIKGLSGVGKTTVIDSYVDRHPRRREVSKEGERTVIPILKALAPVPCSVGALISKLIQSTDDPLSMRRSRLATEEARLLALIRNCSVEMIILDEVQHLAFEGKEDAKMKSANWLKNFITEAKISVVIAGVPSAERLFEQQPQLRSRFSLRADMLPYDWRDRQSQRRFLKFLELVDGELPFSSRSGLAEPDTAMAIYQASSGLPRYCMNLIRSAAIRAARQDAAIVRSEDLAVTYEEELNHFDGNLPNPFVTPPQLSQLVPPGEFSKDDR